MNRDFRELIEKKWAEGKFVCVGLDSDYETIRRNSPLSSSPDSRVRWPDVSRTIVNFNKKIVEATKDLVCAYKPNLAFYVAYGDEGVAALNRTIMDIRILAPDVPVILDAKFADIGNTNAGYAKFAFEYLGADAVTVNPYLGREALQPFLDRKDKGIFVLCRTSNPGSGEFQDYLDKGCSPLYQYVAFCVMNRWNENGNCAMVAGATYPGELGGVRLIVGDMPILIPGVGAQGGNVDTTVKEGKDSRGRGMIINSSRGIIFASSDADFAEAARRETMKLHTLINQCQ